MVLIRFYGMNKTAAIPHSMPYNIFHDQQMAQNNCLNHSMKPPTV